MSNKTSSERVEAVFKYLKSKNGERLEDSYLDQICDYVEQSDTHPIDAYLLLMQCFLLYRSVRNEKVKRIEYLYARLLLTTDIGFNEFYKLGEVVCILINCVSNQGNNCLEDCKIELPIDKSYNSLYTRKIQLNINNICNLHLLQQMWCFTIHNLLNDTIVYQNNGVIIPSHMYLSTLLNFCKHLTSNKASALTIISVCSAISAVVIDMNELLENTLISSIECLIDWLKFTIGNFCLGIGNDDQLGSNVLCEYILACNSITKCISLIALHSDISNSMSVELINKLTVILNSFVIDNRFNLYKVCSNNNFIDCDITPSNNDDNNSKPEHLISVITQALLKILFSFCINNPINYRSIDFFLSCCIDIHTSQIVISNLTTLLKRREIIELFVNWLVVDDYFDIRDDASTTANNKRKTYFQGDNNNNNNNNNKILKSSSIDNNNNNNTNYSSSNKKKSPFSSTRENFIEEGGQFNEDSSSSSSNGSSLSDDMILASIIHNLGIVQDMSDNENLPRSIINEFKKLLIFALNNKNDLFNIHDISDTIRDTDMDEDNAKNIQYNDWNCTIVVSILYEILLSIQSLDQLKGELLQFSSTSINIVLKTISFVYFKMLIWLYTNYERIIKTKKKSSNNINKRIKSSLNYKCHSPFLLISLTSLIRIMNSYPDNFLTILNSDTNKNDNKDNNKDNIKDNNNFKNIIEKLLIIYRNEIVSISKNKLNITTGNHTNNDNTELNNKINQSSLLYPDNNNLITSILNSNDMFLIWSNLSCIIDIGLSYQSQIDRLHSKTVFSSGFVEEMESNSNSSNLYSINSSLLSNNNNNNNNNSNINNNNKEMYQFANITSHLPYLSIDLKIDAMYISSCHTIVLYNNFVTKGDIERGDRDCNEVNNNKNDNIGNSNSSVGNANQDDKRFSNNLINYTSLICDNIKLFISITNDLNRENNTLTLDTNISSNCNNHRKIFSSLRNLLSVCINVINHSYEFEMIFLQKCIDIQPNLLSCINININNDCNCRNIDMKLLRMQILGLVRKWSIANNLAKNNNNSNNTTTNISTNNNLQTLNDDLFISSQKKQSIMNKFFLEKIANLLYTSVQELWPCLNLLITKEINEYIQLNDKSEDLTECSMDINEDINVTNGTYGDVNVNTNSSSKIKLLNMIELINMILHLRTLIAILSTFYLSNASLISNLSAISNIIDDLVARLVAITINSFTLRVYLSQFITISMLDHIYQEESFIDLNVIGNQSVNLGSLGTLVCCNLRRPLKKNKPGNYIEFKSLTNFIRCSALINPQLSIWVLSELIRVWSQLESDDDKDRSLDRDNDLYINYYLLSDEIYHLANNNLIGHLFVSHLSITIEKIILPMLRMTNARIKIILKILINDFQEHSFLKILDSSIISQVSLIRGNDASIASQKLKSGVLGTKLVSSLIDEKPLIFYHILVSDTVQRCADLDLVQGHLFEILEHCASVLDIPIFSDTKMQNLTIQTFQKTLLPLIWDLGSVSERKDISMKALLVLCTIYLAKYWCVFQANGSIRVDVSNNEVSTDLKDNVSTVLPGSFLYIMSNLIQKNWTYQTQNQQIHSVRALKEVVNLLKDVDLIKFLPKIITVIDTVLGSASPFVRHAGVELTCELTKRLPKNILIENLSAFIVGLFPILESSCIIEGVELDILALNDLKSIGQIKDTYYEPYLQFNSVSCGLSRDMQYICEASFSQALAKVCDETSKLISISLIKDIFLNKNIDTKITNSLAYIPLIQGLEKVQDLHKRELSSLSFEQKLRLLCGMLQHKTSHVRVSAINRLSLICKQNRTLIYKNISAASMSGTSYIPDNVISILLQELLKLCSRESEANVLNACAKCLGELGAIDPARVNYVLPSSKTTRLLSKSSSLIRTPWEWNGDKLGLYLLENHLVPGLSTQDISGQDRTGFAIQEVLKKMSKDNNEGNEMPLYLKSILISKNIHSVTEPFWLTKYTMEDVGKSASNSPIFRPNMTYKRWIGLWVKFLTRSSRGPYRAYFQACRGTVRARESLSQFLLPHLIVDILIHQDILNEERKQMHIQQQQKQEEEGSDDINMSYEDNNNEEANSILIEINCILSGNDSNDIHNDNVNDKQGNQMAIQSVFVLLDTLDKWISKPSVKIKKDKYNNLLDQVIDGVKVPWSKAIKSIKKLIGQVSIELLGRAALRIKAYARALRYFEIHARDIHRNKRLGGISDIPTNSLTIHNSIDKVINTKHDNTNKFQLYTTRNDGSNRELPTLDTCQLDHLMKIYSKLEDPDVLQGIHVIRQIQGFPSTPWNRIAELQQTEDWISALMEYSLLSDHHYVNQTVSIDNKLENKIDNDKLHSKIIHKIIDINIEKDDELDQLDSEDIDVNTNMNTNFYKNLERELVYIKNQAEVERGRLRSLIELGQLDAVIDQSIGLIERVPLLEASLLPLGIEASWRLSQWDVLNDMINKIDNKIDIINNSQSIKDRSIHSSIHRDNRFNKELANRLKVLPEDEFQISLGRLMQFLHINNHQGFHQQLKEARLYIMSSLSAASMESYGCAYPHLTKLHILHEVESGFDLVHNNNNNNNNNNNRIDFISQACDEALIENDLYNSSNNSERLLELFQWNERMEMMSPSMRQRSTALAIRRSLLTSANMSHHVAENWLYVSKSLRQSGHFDASKVALRNSELLGLNANDVLIQECKILKGSNQINKALMLLEPVVPDIQALRTLLKTKGHILPNNLDTEQKRLEFSSRLFLATIYMVDSSQNVGRGIIERFKCCIDLEKKNDKAHFELARYFEFLYSQKDDVVIGSVAGLSNSPRQGSVVSDDSSFGYIMGALRHYGQCMQMGNSYTTQALPRMLTLWFSFTSIRDESNTENGLLSRYHANSITNTSTSMLKKNQAKVNELMSNIEKAVLPSTWFTCMPQLASRTGHWNKQTLEIINSILGKVLLQFPQEGIWHIASLLHSFNSDRRQIGALLCKECYTKLMQRSRKEDAQMIQDSNVLFTSLIKLARDTTKEKKIRWTGAIGLNLNRFLVPSQYALHPYMNNNSSINKNSNLLNSRSGGGGGSDVEDTSYFSHSQKMYIQCFHEEVDVASSKAKPKTLTLTTTCGRTVRFLVKQEKNGDLRKDARLMEFNSVVNGFLQEDQDGRKRSLRLRTFSVVCLDEECGILEWVENTNCVRHLINDSHSYWDNKEIYPMVNYRDIYQPYLDMQEKYGDNIEVLTKEYKLLVTNKLRPCFHRWFIESFSDPTEWLEARVLFTRSCAVWSVVGHVVGLGDRHTENILLDLTNGECVHVDFDCLFDKGLTLSRPEIVPFRLTPNFVDAMGLTGVEGTFRRTMEVTMNLMRDNKDTLLSILEPFLRDPTVAWSRSGRAQRGEKDGESKVASSSFLDSENADATEVLKKIAGRLSGIYNLSHPRGSAIMKAYERRKQPIPSRGIGAWGKEELALPLSVQGQVQRLIIEAISDENLSQMYIGWQPYA